MRHAGGEKTDAGHLFAADHFFGALPHLFVQIVADLLKSRGHVVERTASSANSSCVRK